MEKPSEKNIEAPPDPNFILTQYRECYERLRQHDAFIWQTPSIAVTIASGLVIGTFSSYVTYWLIRGMLLTFGTVLVIALLIATIKHRFFSDIEQHTLEAIEKEFKGKIVQRTSQSIESTDYWYIKKPNKFQSISAHHVLVICMSLISVLLLGLTIWCFIMAIWG